MTAAGARLLLPAFPHAPQEQAPRRKIWHTAAPGSGPRLPHRVGLFGLLGSGNLGNDASMDVVLSHLRRQFPDVVVDAMCMGPAAVRQYGIDGIPMLWSRELAAGKPRLLAVAIRATGKLVDVFRTLSWVRRHDLVVVPGMGALDASLPLRATGTPYAMFLLGLAGRLTRTKVALLSVGASVGSQRLVRWLFATGARLATYRSFRDEASRRALAERGIDTSSDPVFTDLVFARPVPERHLGDPRTVGVGIMAYHGGPDDRHDARAISERYLRTMTSFIGWLLDHDYRVRLVWGDDVDQPAVDTVVAAVHLQRPGLAAASFAVGRLPTLTEVVDTLSEVGTVVGTRFHTVLSALTLGKPTISVGYGDKHTQLMTSMGIEQFSLSARSVDQATLVDAFLTLEATARDVRDVLAERNASMTAAARRQLAELSTLVEHCPQRERQPAKG